MDKQALAADLYRILFAQVPLSLLGNLLGLLIFVLIYWAVAPHALLLAWAGGIVLLSVPRLLHYLRFRRRRSVGDAQLVLWGRSWRVLLHCQGLAWAAGIWLFYGHGGQLQLLAMIVVVFSYSLGVIHTLALVPKDLALFVGLMLLSLMANIGLDDRQPLHVELASTVGILYMVTLMRGRDYRRTFNDAIVLRRRTLRLAEQLHAETQRSDESRREAVEANLAKSRFLAAASHDLRQPLHALGLFAEALRQRTRDAETAGLINSINESVDALEGLFGELLDISRLEAGAQQAECRAVPVREVFAHLRLQFEPVAFEKGLMLSFRGEHLVLHTDPVMIERILGNLLSNALRYTEDGGVLVSCRLREGQVLLQVWDSGVGIDAALLPRIFDEFVQGPSQRLPEAQRRKGLGLGLAIVKRLSALLQTAVSVRSRVGHGSVFSLMLPADRPELSAAPDRAVPVHGHSLIDRLIVVVEDDRAVTEGLTALLRSWGAEVLAFESARAVTAWAHSSIAIRPDLLLLDYGLGSGPNGLEVLKAVRAAFDASKQSLPAIMVTGSKSRHELDAQADDYHLLFKPLLPNKLRAMISFKLGTQAA